MTMAAPSRALAAAVGASLLLAGCTTPPAPPPASVDCVTDTAFYGYSRDPGPYRGYNLWCDGDVYAIADEGVGKWEYHEWVYPADCIGEPPGTLVHLSLYHQWSYQDEGRATYLCWPIDLDGGQR